MSTRTPATRRRRLRHFAARHWQIILLTVLALIGWLLQLSGNRLASFTLLDATALSFLLPLCARAWRHIKAGNVGVDVLAMVALVSAVFLRQPWAALSLAALLLCRDAALPYVERHLHHEYYERLAGERNPLAHVMRGRRVIDSAANALQPGDKIIVEAGEMFPADDMIVTGETEVDEALFGDKSQATRKTTGADVLAGSLNIGNSVTVRVTRSGKDTFERKIIRLIGNSRSANTPFISAADRYSIAFIIVALGIAIISWVVGHHASRFLEVLCVATPAPLLLAVPAALRGSMSRASEAGIVFKSGRAFEQLAEVRHTILCMSGVLTNGAYQLKQLHASKPYNKNDILQLIASAEIAANPGHARAITLAHACQAKNVRVLKARQAVVDSEDNVRVSIGGKHVLIGSSLFLATHSVAITRPPRLSSPMEKIQYIAVNGQFAGYVVLEEQLRGGITQATGDLRASGIEHIVALASDATPKPKATAKLLGVDAAQIAPSAGEKLRFIEGCKDEADASVMVICASPADASLLTAADVGIGLGAKDSPEIFEAADIAIMPSSLEQAAQAIRLVGSSLRATKRLVLLTSALDLALMLVCMTGWIPALLGVGLQAVIIMSAILGALLVRRIRY